MHRKLILLLFMFFLCFSVANAQYQIYGVVQDANSNALPGSTVMLLHAKDSVLATFAPSKANGSFLMKQRGSGDYILQITFVGFGIHSERVTLGAEQDVEIGIVIMREQTEELDVVEITSQRIPVQINKDTIQYNAKAFKTQPNANVEQLLKKLPGIEVETDGSIKAQGENVEKVLVDGKDFFGSDPKVATKNLPADAIDKVEVFDKLSDMSEFTGIDDGERTKTINLELKEDHKEGLFGVVEGGYGTDERFAGKASINRFSKKSQMSILGMGNNVNQQGFSIGEYVDFAGGMQALARNGAGGGRMHVRSGDSGVQLSQGISDGLVRSFAGGINYNVDLSKKTDLRSSYFYNGIKNSIEQDIYRQNFLGRNDFNTIEDVEQLSQSGNHRLSINLRTKLDSTQDLRINSNFSFNDGSFETYQYVQNLNTSGELQNESTTDNASDGTGLNGNANLTYRKKLGKAGRNLSAVASLRLNESDKEAELESISDFPITGAMQRILQDQTDDSGLTQYTLRASFMEPLGGRKYLEVNYRRSHITDNSTQNVYDIDPDNGMIVYNPQLSNQFERFYDYDVGGVNFVWNTNKFSLTTGAELQRSLLDGNVADVEVSSKSYTNFLPSFRFRYDISTSRNFRIDYTTSVNEPSIEQLQPIIDNTDPLSIYVGNPELDPSYQHRLSLRFHSFSQFSFTSIFASITGRYTKDKIINSTTINDQFQQVISPLNINNEKNVSGYVYFGTPIRSLKSQFNINTRASYTATQVFVNRARNDVDRWNQSFGFSFRNQNTEKVEAEIGANWGRNITKYSVDTNLDQEYWNHRYSGSLIFNFLDNWSVQNGLTFTIYTGDAFDDVQDLPIWSASISRYVFKDKKGQLKLSVFDLLDKNKGISRNADINYIEEVNSNSIGRYFMMSFLYSIKGFGQERGFGRGRMMRMRH